jgi:hypothetical protein
MVEPEAVAAMLRLMELGWGSKRTVGELGGNRRTVRRYLGSGGWQPYKKTKRKKLLEGLKNWLRERLRQHHRNGDAVHQELSSAKGMIASRRTVRRALEPYCQELRAEALAPVRFGARQTATRRLRRAAGRDRRPHDKGVFVHRPRSATRVGRTCAHSAMSGRKPGIDHKCSSVVEQNFLGHARSIRNI